MSVLCQDNAVLISVTVQYSLKLGCMTALIFFFLSQDGFVIQGLCVSIQILESFVVVL